MAKVIKRKQEVLEMAQLIKKSFDAPDEIVEFPKVKIDIVTINGIQVRRLTCDPGWVWTRSVGPEQEKGSCPLNHAIWIVTSGCFAVKMDDGAAAEYGPGDIGAIPPGHDAWVVGDEPVIGFDFLAESFAKKE
jgi:hypothetical protein